MQAPLGVDAESTRSQGLGIPARLWDRLAAGEDGAGAGWGAGARADLCEPFGKSTGCKGKNGVDVQSPFSANTVTNQIPLLVSNSTRSVSPWTQSSVTKPHGRASAEHACALISQCLVNRPNRGGLFLRTIRGSFFLAVFSLLFHALFTNLKALLQRREYMSFPKTRPPETLHMGTSKYRKLS